MDGASGGRGGDAAIMKTFTELAGGAHLGWSFWYPSIREMRTGELCSTYVLHLSNFWFLLFFSDALAWSGIATLERLAHPLGWLFLEVKNYSPPISTAFHIYSNPKHPSHLTCPL